MCTGFAQGQPTQDLTAQDQASTGSKKKRSCAHSCCWRSLTPIQAHSASECTRSLQIIWAIHCTCHEIRARKRSPFKVLRLPRNLHFEVKPLSQKVDFGPSKPQRERSRDKHQRQPTRFCEPAQSKCTSRISRGMNLL